MVIQLPPQRRAESVGALCGKVLADHRKAQAARRQNQHHAAHLPDVARIPIGNTNVNDFGSDQRNDQFEDGFQ